MARMARTLSLLLATALLGMFVFTGCAPDVAEEPVPPPVAEPGPGEVPPAQEPPTASPPGEPVASAFPWLDVELEDVQTGERFRISDFTGRPVLVKSFAVW